MIRKELEKTCAEIVKSANELAEILSRETSEDWIAVARILCAKDILKTIDGLKQATKELVENEIHAVSKTEEERADIYQFLLNWMQEGKYEAYKEELNGKMQ